MIDIKFNTGKTFDKGGDIMSVKNLYEIKVAQGTKKEDLPWLQMFNSGKRETKDTTDWSKWNGCVYSDIDLARRGCGGCDGCSSSMYVC